MNMAVEPTTDQQLPILAARNVDVVYAAALRQLRGDSHAAADVTQAVMLVVMRKSSAHAMPNPRIFHGWLLKITRYAILQYLRAKRRRAFHENRAAQMSKTSTNEQPADTAHSDADVRAMLDDALLSLGQIDREAIVRRYLKGETLAEVAMALGMTENTAGRRVTRAIEKLRKILGVPHAMPAATLTAVLSAESLIKSSPACASVSTAPSVTSLADDVMRKLLVAQLMPMAWAIGAAAILVGVAVAAILPASAPSPLAVATPATPPNASPGAITIDVSRVIEASSDALLQKLLMNLQENRAKLRSIHLSGIIDRGCHFSGSSWSNSIRNEGDAWLEAGGDRRFRMDFKLAQSWVAPRRGQLQQQSDASFITTWDGNTVRTLYDPPLSTPRGEIHAEPPAKDAQWLVGENFSTQLPWDRETSMTDKKFSVDIDRDPLDPAVLAMMKLSARHVVIDGDQDAMELDVDIPDPHNELGRKETFWFDVARGYALLAREDSLTMPDGTVARKITRKVDEMIEAAPGVFYPSKATEYWEERGHANFWERFEASSIKANEPVSDRFYHVDFPAGIDVMDSASLPK